MERINRRRVLGALGALGGCGLLPGCASQASTEVTTVRTETSEERKKPVPTAPPAWKYIPLDCNAVAETAYRIYPDGGCMYALVGSVMIELARKAGEPFQSFPYAMMRYGDGGVGGWGSMCGVVNGGAALIGLFHGEKSKETREALITDLCVWYETTSLPAFKPAEPLWAEQAEPCVAGSLLCHVSVAEWCKATGLSAFCMEKKERCRRLATDGVIKVVEILNRKAEEEACEFAPLTPDVKACIDCHGKNEPGDAVGKMRCATCHQFDKKHPSP